MAAQLGLGFAQQGACQLVAFPEFVDIAVDLRLPAQGAQDEAAPRVAVVAVQRVLAAAQQALGAQKAVVQLVTRGVDEIQPGRRLGLAVHHKDHMGLGQRRAGVVDAGQLVKGGLAGQIGGKGQAAVVGHGLRGCAAAWPGDQLLRCASILIHRGLARQLCRCAAGGQSQRDATRRTPGSAQRQTGVEAGHRWPYWLTSSSASNSASRSDCSASISSLRSPSMMKLSLYKVRLMRWSVTRPCGKL